MSLTREATIIKPGYQVGDIKHASYDIAFTANQLVEPSNDPGWFLLNGAVISQTTYPILFARYGTTFNTGGEGTGNFRLPNHAEGVFPIGMGLTNFTSYGGFGGEINHTLTLGEMPVHGHTNSLGVSAGSHGHGASGTTDYGGAHTHPYTRGFTAAITPSGAQNQIDGTGSPLTSGGEASHTHSLSFSALSSTESFNKSGGVSNSTGGSAHNNMMPYLVIGGLLVKYG